MRVTPGNTTCPAVSASTDGIDGTILTLVSSVPQPFDPQQTQSGASFVTWSNIQSGSSVSYTLNPTPPDPNLIIVQSCINGASSALTTVLNPGQTIDWELGYTLGNVWYQAEGGDVYGASTIRSYIPASTSPQEYVLDGLPAASGYPGVVTYGVSADFDSDVASTGNGFVSSRDWLVNETYPTVDYYEVFYRRFGAPTANDNGLFPSLSAVAKPASRITPYYISGDMRTSGNWNVVNNETVVFLIDGNLIIDGNITVTGTGFAAFIVNGNITIDPSVGGPAASSNPVVEGVYITSPTGVFQTGDSSSAGNERFVGRGIFVAGDFLLQRDLDSAGANPTTPSELFSYNPQLLVTMPDAMKDIPLTWQEVPPSR